MKKVFMFAAVAAAVVFGQEVKAQDGASATHSLNITVPAIARLDLEAASSTTLAATFVDTQEAGDDITNPSNNTSLWLNYTSILPTTGVTSRTVKVKLSTAVSGVDVKISAGAATAGGKGTKGTPAGSPITLTTTDQDLITGIGSAYTVSGVSNGHNLTYSFEASDTNFGLLRGSSTAQTATVTYTLADI